MAKILVVDDNEQLNSMLKDVLESWDYTALMVTEGFACLDVARREMPDIILLDIMLPGLSGYEVCSALKSDPATKGIAVIMMTALEDVESRIHGFKVGADSFLVKPINYNEVHAIIQKLSKDKRHNDTMEEQSSVAKVIRRLGLLLLGKPTNINTPNLVYCNKLLESLNWDEVTAEQARIALLMPSPADISKRLNVNQEEIFALFKILKMGQWLDPIFRFLSAPADDNAMYLDELKKQQCLPAAELALIVNRYTRLLSENQDRELTFSILKREAGPNHYNKEVLKHLEEILRAEQILENMK